MSTSDLADLLWRQTLSGWLIVITLLYAIFQYGVMLYRRRSIYAYLHVNFVFTGTLTLLVLDVLDDAIYRLTGWNNLFWYLGYSLAALTTYLIGVSICRTGIQSQRKSIERWVQFGFYLVLVLLSLLYFAHLQYTSNWPKRLPRDWPEFVFSQALFLYATFVGVISIRGRLAFLKDEANPVVRARVLMAILASGMAFLCFFAKVIYIGIAFFYRDFPWIDKLALSALAGLVLCWLMGVMPKSFYIVLLEYNPFQRLRQLWQLYQLRQLHQRLDWLCPLPQLLPLDRFGIAMRDLNQSSYRTMIAILDRHKVLKGFIEKPDSHSAMRPDWDPQQQQSAKELYRALATLDEHRKSNREELTRLLIQIGQKTRAIRVPKPPVPFALQRGRGGIDMGGRRNLF